MFFHFVLSSYTRAFEVVFPVFSPRKHIAGAVDALGKVQLYSSPRGEMIQLRYNGVLLGQCCYCCLGFANLRD
jgi:hypothetical protein